MLSLFANEWMKIFNKKHTWIILFLTIVITAGFSITTQIDHSNNKDWHTETRNEIQRLQQQLQTEDISDMMKRKLTNDLQLSQYRLDHQIPPITNSPWKSIIHNSGLIETAILFSMIVASLTVADEIASGTMKLLLIRPHSRHRILFSKYLATILFSALLLMLAFGTGYLTNTFWTGWGNIDATDLFFNQDGQIVQKNLFLQSILLFATNMIPMTMYVTIAFAISTLLHNSALSVGVSLFMMIVGNSLIELAPHFPWMKFLPFINSDVTLYFFHLPPLPDMTLTFSISILLTYTLIINIITWMIFQQRDIT